MTRAVTLDMAKAYAKAVTEACPHAVQVLDRLYVQRLAHDALGQVRRAEVHSGDDPDDRRALENTRGGLPKNRWNLTAVESEKLSRGVHTT